MASCLSFKRCKSRAWASSTTLSQKRKAGRSTTTAPSTSTRTRKRKTFRFIWTPRWTTASSPVSSPSLQNSYFRRTKNARPQTFRVSRRHQWTKHSSSSPKWTNSASLQMDSRMWCRRFKMMTCKDSTQWARIQAGSDSQQNCQHMPRLAEASTVMSLCRNRRTLHSLRIDSH